MAAHVRPRLASSESYHIITPSSNAIESLTIPPPKPTVSNFPSPAMIVTQNESSLVPTSTGSSASSATPSMNFIDPDTKHPTSKGKTIAISAGLVLTGIIVIFLICCVPQIVNRRRASGSKSKRQPQHKQLRMHVRRPDSAQTLVGGVGRTGRGQGWYHEARVQGSAQKGLPRHEIAGPVPPPEAYKSSFRPRR